MYLFNSNITFVEENNYSVVDKDTDVWYGELPYKTGMQFPTSEIKERAMISNTNKLIFENRVDEIYNNLLSIFPETDFMTSQQIREIIMHLPYFKNSTNAWVSLVAGDTPLIDAPEDLDEQISAIIENSNFVEILQSEVRSRFLDVISAYRVDIGLNNKPVITSIDTKNLIVFVNKNITNSIEVVVVFSIYKDEDGHSKVDFVEYHYNGKIIKSTFEYNREVLGNMIERFETKAFNGMFEESPIVVFKHNTSGNKIYGTDQYRYWYPSMVAAMREMQNIFRLGERTREIIRKVPEGAIKLNPSDGSSFFFNKGVISYNEKGEGDSPDIEYIVPEIRMTEAVDALKRAVNQVAIDTQLGMAFFDPSNLGARLSADSLRVAMFPARLEAKRITAEMKKPAVELIKKLAYLGGLQLQESKLSLEFYDGFPKDELDDIKAVQLRLESNKPSLTLEDAIMKLDKVSLRVARQKANEIKEEALKNKGIFEDKLDSDGSGTEKPTLESLKVNKDTEVGVDTEPVSLGYKIADTKEDTVKSEDGTLWESQLVIKPNNVKGGD